MANNWAIVIGINQYHFLQPLKYAKRDAEAINTFLAQSARFDRIFLFTDDSPPINGKPTEPFRANLLRVLRQIFATPFMKDGDNLWFFFSGHGIPHNGQDYLMPLDGDPEDIENTGISTNTITNYLRNCGADNAVMILDACRSGGKKAGEGIGRQTEVEARQTGVISLFSCSPDQYSYELEAIGQGAFTYALLEGLGIRGRCATVERLNQYLEHRVPELVSQHLGQVRQIPYTIAEPLNRSHLILMPQHASLQDIATLKIDAYNAQTDENWDLAERLWIRVLAAASGQDADAVRALQRIAIKRHTTTSTVQPEPPQPSDFSKAAPNPAVTPNHQAATRPPHANPVAPTPPSARPSSVSRSHTSSTSRSNSSSTSRPITRQQFLKWAIPAGVGVAGVTVASQVIKLSSQPTSPIPSPSPPPSPSPASSPSPAPSSSSPPSTAVDYSKLEGFLKAGKWKEADEETLNLMLKVANREQVGWLDHDSLHSFPCKVLGEIDHLWVKNSNGKFGFSMQQKIYVEDCGGKLNGDYDRNILECFGKQIKWFVDSGWIGHSSVDFSLQAPIAHLPVVGFWGGDPQKQYYKETPWYEGAPNFAPEKFFFSLSPRIASCSIR